MKSSISSKIRATLQSMDIFASPIGLTYDNNLYYFFITYRSFKSAFGGVITLIMVIVVMAVCALKVKVMINYEQSVSKMNEFLFKSNQETNQMYFVENEFYLMFSLQNSAQTKFYMDKKYGSFMAVLFIEEKATDGSQSVNVAFEPISLISCDNETLKINQNEKFDIISNYNLSNYLCPEEDIYIQGLSLSNRFVRPMINYEVCHDQDYCATAEEMAEFFESAVVSVLSGDRWFDPNNYVEPFQQYFQTAWRPIEEDKFAIIQLLIFNNTAYLSDSYLGLTTEQVDFLKLNQDTNYITQQRGGSYSLNEYQIFRIILELSPEKMIYERQVYNINNLMSDVGGFFNSFLFLGSIVFYTFKNSIFYTSLLTKLYYGQSVEKVKIQVDQEFQSSNFKRNLSSMAHSDNYSSRSKSIQGEILQYFSSLKQMSYKKSDIIRLGLKSLPCCLRCSKPRRNDLKNHFYKRGQQKFIDELDLVNVIRKLRKVDVLYELVLNQQLQKLGQLCGASIHPNQEEKSRYQRYKDQKYDILEQFKEKLQEDPDHFTSDGFKKKKSKLLRMLLQVQDEEIEAQKIEFLGASSRPLNQDRELSYDQIKRDGLDQSQKKGENGDLEYNAGKHILTMRKQKRRRKTENKF